MPTDIIKSSEERIIETTTTKKSPSQSNSSSNIPVRKPSILKQKTIDDIESNGNHQNLVIDANESFGEITNDSSFNDSQTTNSARNSFEQNNTSPDIIPVNGGKAGKKNGKKNFKSKLPKRK